MDRSALLSGASNEELRELSEGPSAHWEAINRSSTRMWKLSQGRGKTLPLRLTASLEAAMEARYELEEREAS